MPEKAASNRYIRTEKLDRRKDRGDAFDDDAWYDKQSSKTVYFPAILKHDPNNAPRTKRGHTEVNYRTVLMDRTDLRAALEDIERRLNTIRDTMIDDRDFYSGLVGFAADLEGVAASARQALALTDDKGE